MPRGIPTGGSSGSPVQAAGSKEYCRTGPFPSVESCDRRFLSRPHQGDQHHPAGAATLSTSRNMMVDPFDDLVQPDGHGRA